MKKSVLTIILIFILANVYGQKLDSIAYKYGHLFYHSYGNGETIILLSGGPGNNALQLESVALKLSQKNRVVLLEQRGTGRSIPTKFDEETINIKSAVSDINLLLDHLNLKSAIILGHSYGAELAIIYASQFPEKVKSTILISPGIIDYESGFITLCNIGSRLGQQEILKWEELYYKNFYEKISETESSEYNFLTRLTYIYDKSKIDTLLPLMESQLNKNTFNYISNDLVEQKLNVQSLVKKINSPIYIISGRQDISEFVSYELKIANPSIQLHWIDESGHFPMYEQPEEFYKILNQILDKTNNYR
jgi:proline iminopeptidase